MYLLNFVNEKRAERVSKGFIILTLGQDGLRFSVQDFVQLPPQFVRVSRVMVNDFGVQTSLSLVYDGIAPTN